MNDNSENDNSNDNLNLDEVFHPKSMFEPPQDRVKPPRLELTEQAFKRYEKYISRAYNEGSYDLNVRAACEADGRRIITPYTFACRFRDAMFAFRKYSYPSTSIPAKADLSHIKITTCSEGYVQITNTSKDRKTSVGQLSAENWSSVLALCENYDTAIPRTGRKTKITYTTQAQATLLKQLEDAYPNIMVDIVPPSTCFIQEV